MRRVRGEVVGDRRADQFAAFERRFAAVSRVMDELVTVPGTSVRVGLDPLVGLVPVVGDVISAVVGFWLIAAATRFGIPRIVVGRMIVNTVVDMAVGAIPVLGDLFDVVSRSNSRNLALFRRHALDPTASTRGERLALAGIVVLLVGLLWLVATAIGWLLSIRIPTP
ncbi:MAG TPA: DUF4112 domain-containing protein [Candidatus Limnocylindrales bacterium]